MNTKMSTLIPIVIIPVLLAVFFTFSLYLFPHYYLFTRQVSQALPKIINVNTNISSLSDRGILHLHLGESFVVTIASANLGDTSDFQIASVSFPNITTIQDYLKQQLQNTRLSNFIIVLGLPTHFMEPNCK